MSGPTPTQVAGVTRDDAAAVRPWWPHGAPTVRPLHATRTGRPAEHPSETAHAENGDSNGPPDESCSRCDELERELARLRRAAAEETARREAAVLERLRRPYEEAAATLAEAARLVRTQFSVEVVELAVRIACTVTRRAVELDRELARSLLDEALAAAPPVQRYRIECSAHDAESITRHVEMGMQRSGPVQIDVEVRSDLGPGDFVLRFDGARVDARLASRLADIEEALRVELSLPETTEEAGP